MKAQGGAEAADTAELARAVANHISAATNELEQLARALHASGQWSLYRDLGRVEELHSLAAGRMTALMRRITGGDP